ncbi:MAG: hypothetical protein JWR50_2623 [Mucilaginibacter sp.]|nr:hypothetical protein [Mucilaginibacter sp.]
MNTRLVIIALLAPILFSCKQKPTEKKAIIKKSDTLKSVLNNVILSKFTSSEDTIPKITIPMGTIQVTTNDIIDSSLKVSILAPGEYNSEEAIQVTNRRNWKGVFKINGQYYIKKTGIQILKIRSQTDKDDEKTGLIVKTINKDSCEILMSGADVKEGPVRTVLLKSQLFPGQKQEFNYNGVMYTFYATGFKKDRQISNYKLFLMANVKGHNFNQLLFTILDYGDYTERESEENLTLEFAGDMDGDGIPDFIIIPSTQFWSDATLYLSKQAGNKAIVKPVGKYEGVD